MWRRASPNLRALAPWRSALHSSRPIASSGGILTPSSFHTTSPSTSPFRMTSSSLFSTESRIPPSGKKVEDVMPIATGFEREELEAELEGRKRFDMDAPEGPFGTKDAPAVIKSCYDERIVGCPGGEGEDEHDVVWFRLKKGEPHECPVCSQYFVLEVVGPGGPPPEAGHGHGDDDHH